MNYLRRYFLTACLIGLASAPIFSHAAVMTQAIQQVMTPQEALQRLQEGNERFVAANMASRDLLDQQHQTAAGQFPFAIVLSCLDSRSTPEYIFDQGIGSVFVARVAGNIQNSDILGSMEFGAKLAGAKLIVVMGHTSYGAIRGACQQAKLGNLTGLLNKIQPAVAQASKETKTKNCEDANFIDQIAKDNVLLVVKQIQEHSPVLKKMIQEGQIGIVGAMQDISNGKVTFFDLTSGTQKDLTKGNPKT